MGHSTANAAPARPDSDMRRQPRSGARHRHEDAGNPRLPLQARTGSGVAAAVGAAALGSLAAASPEPFTGALLVAAVATSIALISLIARGETQKVAEEVAAVRRIVERNRQSIDAARSEQREEAARISRELGSLLRKAERFETRERERRVREARRLAADAVGLLAEEPKGAVDDPASGPFRLDSRDSGGLRLDNWARARREAAEAKDGPGGPGPGAPSG